MSTNPQEPGNEPSFVNENSLRIASESLTHYDENADTYHCSYGPPVPAITIHDPERNMLVRIDPTSHQVIGFTIPNFRASDSIVSMPYTSNALTARYSTLHFAHELRDAGIKVNAACPGYTKTALNNFMGTRTVEEGAREPVRLALLGNDSPTGSYSNDDGPLPW